MKQNVLSRVAYCQKCADNNRPRSGNAFMLYGGDRKTFFMHQNDYFIKAKKKGFTPHLFINHGYWEGTVFHKVEKICGCLGTWQKSQQRFSGHCTIKCGGYKEGDNGNAYLDWNATGEVNMLRMTDKEWKALEAFKDTGYEL